MLRERFPKVDAVFSSDLLRAVQTAEVVADMYKLKVCTVSMTLCLLCGQSMPQHLQYNQH